MTDEEILKITGLIRELDKLDMIAPSDEKVQNRTLEIEKELFNFGILDEEGYYRRDIPSDFADILDEIL